MEGRAVLARDFDWALFAPRKPWLLSHSARGSRRRRPACHPLRSIRRSSVLVAPEARRSQATSLGERLDDGAARRDRAHQEPEVDGAGSATASASRCVHHRGSTACCADRRRRRRADRRRRPRRPRRRAPRPPARARSRDDSQTCQRVRPRSSASGAAAGPRTVTAGPRPPRAASAAAAAAARAAAPSRASMRSAIMRVNGG